MITSTFDMEGYDFSVRKYEGEVRMYFSPSEYYVDKESIEEAINGLMSDGACSGVDTARLNYGEIRAYFNPTYHTMEDQDRIIRVLGDEIFKSREL